MWNKEHGRYHSVLSGLYNTFNMFNTDWSTLTCLCLSLVVTVWHLSHNPVTPPLTLSIDTSSDTLSDTRPLQVTSVCDSMGCVLCSHLWMRYIRVSWQPPLHLPRGHVNIRTRYATYWPSSVTNTHSHLFTQDQCINDTCSLYSPLGQTFI